MSVLILIESLKYYKTSEVLQTSEGSYNTALLIYENILFSSKGYSNNAQLINFAPWVTRTISIELFLIL